MRLVWGKGVEAQNGARSSRDEGFAYLVRDWDATMGRSAMRVSTAIFVAVTQR
jgi:hypothetical protein